MARFYLAAQKEMKGKHYAFVFSVKPGENVPAVIANLGISFSEICENKKSAEALADKWNQIFRENGTSVFS